MTSPSLPSLFSIDDDYLTYAKRARGGVLDAKSFRLGFGKRSVPRPAALAGGIDRMAFGGMKFGKRSAAPAAPSVEEDDEEMFEEDKRMDKAAFRVGFGRR
ncbi:nlp-1 [Pristionchus pacificus]|uniref:Uncharacterized protein n=1 Tax=Pristionchus pacificus TaxID=54126 RepID=A0A2A6BDA8_PRIPA|nr:nlp-1 [Pristionchus pacificus]|eukprot:PDM63859.1 hypothetical protein PRIPAC_49832 [Pristionchus pacificus]